MLKNFDWDTKCEDFPVTPPRFVALIREAVPEDGIVCLDNGLYKVLIHSPLPECLTVHCRSSTCLRHAHSDGLCFPCNCSPGFKRCVL